MPGSAASAARDDEHVDDADATLFVRGGLDSFVAGRVRAHLYECEECRELVGAVFGALATTSRPAGATSPRLQSGATLGRYRLITRLGSGGMGEVWSAHDPELDRLVAIKSLHAEFSDGVADLLMREAEALARLSHPNVVAALQVVHTADATALVMELVNGTTLLHWQRAPGRTSRETLAHYIHAAHGLAAAHSASVIHRDFKPHNVLVGTDGRVQVADFGLAALGERGDSSTRTSESDGASGRATRAGGTPRYMAPEVIAGARGDARSDQFSFCVALWEALNHTPPFAGDDLTSLSRAILGGVLQPPTRPATPAVAKVLRRGLSADPRRRYASMEELVTALERARPRRAPLLLGSMAVILTASMFGSGWQTDSPDCDRAREAMTDVWNPEVVRELERASPVGTTGADHGTTRGTRQLTNWTEGWFAELESACVDESLRARSRVRCLDNQRRAIADVVERMRRADPEFRGRLDEVASGLPPPTECRSVSSLGTTSQGADIRHAIWQTAGEIGRQDESTHARALALLGQAIATEQPSLIAYARVVHGLGLFNAGQPLVARAQFEAAYLDAAGAGDAAMMADAAKGVVLCASLLGRSEEALDWIRHLEAVAAPGDQEAAADVAVLRSEAYRDLGDWTQADAELARGLAVAPLDSPVRARLLADRGRLEAEQGRLAEALGSFEEELAFMEAYYGPDHPGVATSLQHIGVLSAALQRFDVANAAFARAIGLLEVYEPTNVIGMAQARGNYAQVLESQGQLEQALALVREARATIEQQLGTSNLEVARFLQLEAEYESSSGHFAEALARIDRAIAIYRENTTDAPCAAMRIRAQALSHLRRVDDALAAWDDAITCRPIDDDDMGRAYDGRAELLANAGRWREADTAISRAREYYAKSPIVTARIKAELELRAARIARELQRRTAPGSVTGRRSAP